MIITYKYGCPHRTKFDDVAMEQLHKAHDLRNRFVEIDKKHETTIKEIWAQHSEIASKQKTLESIDQKIQILLKKIRNERTKAGSVAECFIGKLLETKDALREARAERKEIKAELKIAKSNAAELKSKFTDAKYQRNTDVTRARKEYVDKGLFWSTATDVLDQHNVAFDRIKKKRKNGESAELHFHRWDETGSISAQIQWRTGTILPTPENIADVNGRWSGIARLTPWSSDGRRPRGNERHGQLRMRVRGVKHGDHHIEIPVVIHRWMPANAEIKKVILTRRRIASNYRLSISVVCRVPDIAPKSEGNTIAIDLDWSSVDNGWRRIARVSALSSLSKPSDEISPLLLIDNGHIDIHCSKEWFTILERDDAIHGLRDRLLNKLRVQIVDALNNDSVLSKQIGVVGAEVARWKAPRRFVQLAQQWPKDHVLSVTLEVWRQRDRHLWEYEANERNQTIAKRRDIYRKIAAWICENAKSIVISELDISEIRKIPNVPQEDTYQKQHDRKQIQQGAPGEFREFIELTAKKRGITLMYATNEKACDRPA